VTLSMLAFMAPADGSSTGLTMLLFQVAAIGLVFYFLILRPQQQARRKHEELVKQLKKGDEVTTVGGIIGKVKDVKENRITIETGSATVVVERARIVKVGDEVAPGNA